MSTRLGSHMITAPSLAEVFVGTQGHPIPLSAFEFDIQTPVMTCPLSDLAGFVALPVAQLRGQKDDGQGGVKTDHVFNVYGTVGVNQKYAEILSRNNHVIHSTVMMARSAVDICNTEEEAKARGVVSKMWSRTAIAEPLKMAITQIRHSRDLQSRP